MTDLVKGLILLMNSNYTQPVNLGNPLEFTISGGFGHVTIHTLRLWFVRYLDHLAKKGLYFFLTDFAQQIHEMVGGNSEIIHVEAVEDDPQRRRPDISRAKSVLGWEPTVSLDTGLRKTIDFFRKELDYANNLKNHKPNLEEFRV